MIYVMFLNERKMTAVKHPYDDQTGKLNLIFSDISFSSSFVIFNTDIIEVDIAFYDDYLIVV